MQGVSRGCGVVPVGVVWFVYACGLGFFGGLSAWGVADLWGASLWMWGRLFDVSRVVFIAKWQRVIFGDTRRYSANE
jgi:hypothetical protein